MSDTAGIHKHVIRMWLGCLLVVSFAAGIWAAFTPSVGPFIRPSVAVLMIIAGLVLLSPFATARPINERQRKARRGVSFIGAGNIMVGIAQLVPSVRSSTALMVTAMLLMAGAMAWFVHSGKAKDSDLS